jgi:hypothetical protein
VRRTWGPALVVLVLMGMTAGILLARGRNAICTCGYVKLFEPSAFSSGTSQHLSDLYTFSHVLHGLIFYGVLWLVARRLPVGWRLVIAVAVEAAWELVENSDTVIDRYRAETVSLDYYGDSVLNSMSDIAAMMLGFLLAAVLPWWASVALFVAVEVLLAFLIRDGLVLNVIMLVHPVDAIREWQEGASVVVMPTGLLSSLLPRPG